MLNELFILTKIKECYEAMGGDYEDVLKRLM